MGSIFKSNATDPVCGIKVHPEQSAFSTIYAKSSYYFCSQACLDAFKRESERYHAGSKKASKGLWAKYLDRVQKATDGKPPCCH